MASNEFPDAAMDGAAAGSGADALSTRHAEAERDWAARPPSCPYCGATAALVTGDVIYREHYNPKIAGRHFFACLLCDAYVGTHNNSRRYAPLGSLANKELRDLRRKVHKLFDPLWRDGELQRIDAYRWLASRMGIEPRRCHIGYFRDADCMSAILILEAHRAQQRMATRR